jgi:hypothetical protein
MSLAATTLLCWQSTTSLLQLGIRAASEWGHTMSHSFLHMVKQSGNSFLFIVFHSIYYYFLFLFITAQLKMSTLPGEGS